MIGLRGIISAFNAGCQNRYEVAEHLHVTEEYLQEAIDCYKGKYGEYITVDNYVILFYSKFSGHGNDITASAFI